MEKLSCAGRVTQDALMIRKNFLAIYFSEST